MAIALDTSPDEIIDWKIQEDQNYLTLMSISALGFLFFPLLGIIIALIAAIIALSLGFFKYIKGKKTKMSSIKLETFNTIKDGVASGLTVVALVLSSQGFYIADGIVGFIIALIIVTIGFAAIKESSYMLIDACKGECIDIKTSVKQIAEEFKEIEKAHIVKLRKSGPIFQGELEVEVSDDMKIKDFDIIKKNIVEKIKNIFPEIEQLTISPIIDNKKNDKD